MNCEEFQGIFSLWQTGELEPGPQAWCVTHLSECSACRRMAEETSAFDLQLRSALQVGPGADAAARCNRFVLRRIGADRRRTWFAGATAAAAVGTLAFFSGSLKQTTSSPPRVLADAARDHHAEVVENRPRRWKSERPDVEAVADSFGLAASEPWSLAPKGFHLLHAKICGLGGKAALHLVYSDGRQSVSLYVEKDREVADSETATIGTERVAYAKGAHGSVLVETEGAAEKCLDIARHAAELL